MTVIKCLGIVFYFVIFVLVSERRNSFYSFLSHKINHLASDVGLAQVWVKGGVSLSFAFVLTDRVSEGRYL